MMAGFGLRWAVKSQLVVADIRLFGMRRVQAYHANRIFFFHGGKIAFGQLPKKLVQGGIRLFEQPAKVELKIRIANRG